MKNLIINAGAFLVLLLSLIACTSTGDKKTKTVYSTKNIKGTYGYDVAFFAENNIKTIELKDPESKACVLLIPDYQGRVMTSTANGKSGNSFGWINYDLIESGEENSQFNPFGGEERFWLGPEGGPFSIYFKEGKEQVFTNWVVPPAIDTESYEVKELTEKSVAFVKKAVLKNAAGSEFNIAINRTVSLLSPADLSEFLDVPIPPSLNVVAYQSENTITNVGENGWAKEEGLLSIWMLCMFNPSPTTTVFIPYKTIGEGVIVNDDYFGKVPSDRLKVEEGTVYFKIDGQFRSKIGLPPNRAKELCGSYDSDKKILTLLWCSLPNEPMEYVNSKWGDQENPYAGDVINSYNDGPVEDGSVMGPFYEIETSSPAAELLPNESLTHTQRVAHIQGDEAELGEIVKTLFNLNIKDIALKF